jgi:methionine synthase II (cobalamin-independent)
MEITKDIYIEELVEQVPSSVRYLMDEGIRCILCGEPIWGTLEDAVLEKGYNLADLERFVIALQELAKKDAQKGK